MSGYDIAKEYRGLHEVKDNNKIRIFLKLNSNNNDININPAETAWCAAFVNACEREAGNIGNGKLNARSFLTYGATVYDRDKRIGKWIDGMKGDIVVFERGGSTWMGHVAYYDGIEIVDGKTLIRTIGGNQSDSVCTAWYPSNRLLGIRRP